MTVRNFARERISRLVDILVAGFALLALAPAMLIIAAAIFLEMGRPIFFSQIRIGRNARPFRIYKFRKFCVDNDSAGPLLTVRNDPRMSRIGRLLERTKLDELPQFYNVLKGDMAMVGPRPDTAVAGDLLTGEFRALLSYKPGIFGPGQVALRNAGALYPPQVDATVFYREAIFPLKARLDLAYYPKRTIARDLLWMLRGVLAVLGLHPTLRQLPQSPEGMRAASQAPAAEQRRPHLDQGRPEPASRLEGVPASARGAGSRVQGTRSEPKGVPPVETGHQGVDDLGGAAMAGPDLPRGPGSRRRSGSMRPLLISMGDER